MNTTNRKSQQAWTESQAKTHLSEILRLAAEKGPQHIDKQHTFVVVHADQWYPFCQPRQPLGKWLVENMPRGNNLNFQFDRKADREVPFRVG